MADLPSFPKLKSFKGFSFKLPDKNKSPIKPNSPIREKSPQHVSNPFNHTSKIDISIINYDDVSQKMDDEDIKFGQVPDIVDYVKWLNNNKNECIKKLLITASNTTRCLNLLLFDENGINDSKGYSRNNYTKILDSMDFPFKISSVSNSKKDFITLGHSDGSISFVKVEDQKLIKKSTLSDKNNSIISAITMSDNFIISGNQQGDLFIDGINSTFNKRKATSIESGINALCAYNDYLLLSGTQDGKVTLFDIRDRVTNGVINLSTDKDTWKKSIWANRYTDSIKKVDMENEFLIAAGTNEGIIRFADIRNPEGDKERKCRLKTSEYSINEIQFSKSGDNKFYACTRSGFVEMDFNSLIGTWFDNNTNKPLYLMDDYYHKIQRKWFTELPNVTAFDIQNNSIVISNKGGELAFIC